MPKLDDYHGQISDYERAVCYYTLPKVITPLTYGLIIAYAVCLLEAVAALGYGLYFQYSTWTRAGGTALVAIVVFGIVVFIARAVFNDVRRRKLLNDARSTPQQVEDNDLPDPFANHLLLARPLNAQGSLFAVTEDDANIQYFVDASPEDDWWKVRTSQDEDCCLVRTLQGANSFNFASSHPSQLGIYDTDNEEIGHIARCYSLGAVWYELSLVQPEAKTYTIRNFGIYYGEQLVGRMYRLRGNWYLDVRKSHFNPALLGYFVTLN